MGSVKHVLASTTLPDREPHNGRMFVDLCENIHLHYREFRIVFGLDEYFEFADILARSTMDVRNYLAQNPDYREGEYPTTLMIAGGPARQRKPLENSPQPHQSKYFANDFAIELQDEDVIDEIHVHWRDYRFALNRTHFRQIADQFRAARDELDGFEAAHDYRRAPHPDRLTGPGEPEQAEKAGEGRESQRGGAAGPPESPVEPARPFTGVRQIPVNEIGSPHFEDPTDFDPDQRLVRAITDEMEGPTDVFPILLSTEDDGSHQIVDGHHRVAAVLRAGGEAVPAVVIDLPFAATRRLREAERALKRFDRETGHRYRASAFAQEFLAFRLGRHHRDAFHRKVLGPTWIQRVYDRYGRLIDRILGERGVRVASRVYHRIRAAFGLPPRDG